MTVYHVLQRAGALKHLSDVDRARHVNRLVDLLDEERVHEGYIPKLNKAKFVAKDVVTELQERYGKKLPHKMLKEYELEEVVIVFCLQKHINKLFDQTTKKKCSSPPWIWFRSFLRR
ncbi:hypothetical protein JOB18_004521 [Solea senegalensis]|uniref:Uncharacterized protein n=1 Tax=Solea senegalensis TaxID=28829 RepID=A0AAV6Q850_SOLSE|nr:hypothetical protein JOB18_004521 [Solea senegalensis]